MGQDTTEGVTAQVAKHATVRGGEARVDPRLETHTLGLRRVNEARNMAQQFADSAPVAVRLTKRSIYANMDSDLREALERESSAQTIAASTKDYREGVNAFVEKRKPRFTGE